jgi:hypothetical protein
VGKRIDLELSRAAQDINEDCPRFVCFAAGDSYVEADNDLEWHIRAIVKDDGLADDESAVIWQDWRYVVAVIGPGGRVTRFNAPAPAPAGGPRLTGK